VPIEKRGTRCPLGSRRCRVASLGTPVSTNSPRRSRRRRLAATLVPVAGLASLALTLSLPSIAQAAPYQSPVIARAIVATAGQAPVVLPQFASSRALPFTGLDFPHGMAVGSTGSLFVTDTGRNVVIEWPKGGSQTTVPFTGLNDPESVAVDPAGDVFVTDTNNNRIVEHSISGSQRVLPFSGLNQPESIAVDPAGDVFVADTNNNQILESAPGQATVRMGFHNLSGPYGVTVDSGGDVFVADTGNNRVVELPKGQPQVTLPLSGLKQPQGVAVDGSGDVYVTDTSNQRVVALPYGGTQVTLGFTGLNNPNSIAVNAGGSVFVADGMSDQVLQLPVGPQLTVATTSVPSVKLGASYPVTTLMATGGTPPYTWSVTSGSWPAGLTITPSGVISGTATESGTDTFTVQVTDAQFPPATDIEALSLQVQPKSLPFVAVARIAVPDRAVRTSAAAPRAVIGQMVPAQLVTRSTPLTTTATTMVNADVGLVIPAMPNASANGLPSVKGPFNPVAVSIPARVIVQAARNSVGPTVANSAQTIVAAARASTAAALLKARAGPGGTTSPTPT